MNSKNNCENEWCCPEIAELGKKACKGCKKYKREKNG